MKRILIFLVIMLISINLVSAVGIKWFTEAEGVNEESVKCITYGAYNPSGRDIHVKIAVEGELSQVIQGAKTETRLIKAGTGNKQAEMIDFCFKVPTVYTEDCLYDVNGKGLICEQKCNVEEKSYDGEVIMTEEVVQSGGTASGSGATIAASAPLRLAVSCHKHKRDWGIVYITLILIVLLILVLKVYKRYRTPKIVRYEDELKKLQAKIKKEKKGK
jgi:hypothetical protein